MQTPQVTLIVPLYNEEETLPHLIERLDAVLASFPVETEVVLVNDGSKDRTSEMINLLGLSNPKYQIVELSRNFGHPYAITAGMQYARGNEAIMILDGDLQDPPELLHDFYALIKEGYDVVYGVRKKRKENFLKVFAYAAFYRILKSISTIDMPLDSGDFSMISRRVVDLLNQMPEESRYVRGMRTWLGFNQYGYEYERQGRFAGNSKYSFKALMRLAYNGIFNFSEFPITFITRIGVISLIISLIYTGYALFMKIEHGAVPEGFTALLFTITMFGGIQLISLGIIGEYVTRIFFQSKNRPLFVVKNHIVNSKKNG